MAMKIIMGQILICFMINPIHADNYRWVDEEGVVNFSDALPSDSASVKDVVYIPEVSYVESTNERDPVEELNQTLKILQDLRTAKQGKDNDENKPVTMSFSDQKKLENLNRRIRHISSSYHSATQVQLDAARTEIAAIHSKYGLSPEVYSPAPVERPVVFYRNRIPSDFYRLQPQVTPKVVSPRQNQLHVPTTTRAGGFAGLTVSF